MSQQTNFSDINNDKIGNALIYIIDRIKVRFRQDVYLTKLLKLLYIIDETAVLETGVPMTWLEYKVWQAGPVAQKVYDDLNSLHLTFLEGYVEPKKIGKRTKVESTSKFEDSEFSDYEIDLMNRVIEQYGSLNGGALVALLHEENSLWSRIVTEQNLEDFFLSNTKTDICIDLKEKIKGDAFKSALFDNAKISLQL
jgi:uncharacterized phage-associated protein